ncbi:uncharacterized protein [Elaeis guineensis]|uniref:Uncharacterized protein LOC105053184 isoform X2 n=1 Tax=Elaeis guineensis var. tenera TaxID=51953 RepID=A0A6I9RUG4_ELAGV|nr:uncharacterized protein LOC105053184 isoform X2 [Elaeis guineensis]
MATTAFSNSGAISSYSLPPQIPNLNFYPTNPRFNWSSKSPSSGRSAIIRRLRRYCSPVPNPSCSLDLPLLPFELDEVLIPSEFKTLHLYEARFLALLEESLQRRKKLFVHFVLDPFFTSRSSAGASFAARYGCLVLIESIKQLEIGALVSIRGIGRVRIVELMQMEPYLRGVILPILDDVSGQKSEIDSKLLELRKSIHNLHSLQIKLKASKNELLQTRIKNSLAWAEREVYEDCDQAFIPNLAERLSFAALQTVSGMSDSELLALQSEKLRAMDSRDTVERLRNGIKFTKQNINMVAAKLAIQSLGI